jgi:hypothetical protein
VQLAGVNVPDEAPLLKLAVPCGHDCVGESVSDTVAVQTVEPLIGLVAGEHDVEVDVVRRVTVNPNPVASVLSAWTLSLAVYDALIVCVPAPPVGVYVTEQLEVDAVIGASEQLPALKVPLEGPLPNVAVPCGADLVGESVSVTVAVQVVELSIGLLIGVHEVEVDVVRSVTVNADPPASALSACTKSLAV